MLIKDILKISCVILNSDEVLTYLTDNVYENEDVIKESELLFKCFNLVINELSSEYLPFKDVKTLNTPDGIINYALLDNKVTDILSVKNGAGENMDFSAYPLYIKINAGAAGAAGSVTVEYSYIPEFQSVSGEVNIGEKKITERIIAYGICAEYCLICGQYDEALIWDKRYKDSLASVMRKTKRLSVPARSWN